MPKGGITVRRVAFWTAVGTAGVLGNFFVELLADHVNSPGLRRFVAYLHRGHGTGGPAQS